MGTNYNNDGTNNTFIPSRIFKNVPKNGVGSVGVVIADANIAPPNLILIGHLLQFLDQLQLSFVRKNYTSYSMTVI